ncbi:hydroxymethylbilane synthase [Natronobiforma cellulositropha]|uniref:hydroxymethylbilane synthase n=1 Tax=Natronobiforma cellulositropha TaxID=1679076 RepID=UPI0021D5ACDB|nr:hydroxymethylbilane synthase [Natronobiforma cellulositropha]
MKTRGTIRLATRGSTLALRQADLVVEALEARGYEVDLVTVETTGDQIRDELIHRLGKTGAFVRELDERVLAEEVDGAIHSMKDMPTEQPSDLVTAVVPERGRPGDVLVTPDGSTLEELPEGATVGTSSLRRRAQLLAARPDLSVEPVRGNVDTRLEKLLASTMDERLAERREAAADRRASAGDGYKPDYSDDEEDEPLTVDEWVESLSSLERGALERETETNLDALVLAEAGLDRSGLAEEVDYERLPTADFVPAPGQGALAVTALDGELARDLRGALDHPRTRVETTAERTVLATLGGGCIAPIGVYAVLQGEYVHTSVQVYDADGEASVVASRDLPVERYAETAREFAHSLESRGAGELIAAAREDGDVPDEPEGK